MSVEDRLLVLLNEARQSGGDAALHDAAGLRSRLSSQAPDLHGEIQAMAAALAMGAPVRIALSDDVEAERAAIAAEIARQERLSMSVVAPGLAVACRGGAGIGPRELSLEPPAGGEDWAGDSVVFGAVDAPSSRKPGDDSWAGDSVAVGAAPAPIWAPAPDAGAYAHSPLPFTPPPGPYRPPHGGYGRAIAKPFYTQTWFFALVVAFIISAAVGYTLWRDWGAETAGASAAPSAPPPGTGPEGRQPPDARPADSGPRPGGPALTALDAQPARLPQQRLADGRIGIGFRVVAASGPIDGMIILPSDGWEGETTVIAANGAGAQSVGSGQLTLEQGEGGAPVRSMEVQWRQDGVGAGSTQIAFASAPGQNDVLLSGSGMCIADPESGQIIGCGQIE